MAKAEEMDIVMSDNVQVRHNEYNMLLVLITNLIYIFRRTVREYDPCTRAACSRSICACAGGTGSG